MLSGHLSWNSYRAYCIWHVVGCEMDSTAYCLEAVRNMEMPPDSPDCRHKFMHNPICNNVLCALLPMSSHASDRPVWGTRILPKPICHSYRSPLLPHDIRMCSAIFRMRVDRTTKLDYMKTYMTRASNFRWGDMAWNRMNVVYNIV